MIELTKEDLVKRMIHQLVGNMKTAEEINLLVKEWLAMEMRTPVEFDKLPYIDCVLLDRPQWEHLKEILRRYPSGSVSVGEVLENLKKNQLWFEELKHLVE